jgi:hypothetical protein
MISLKVTIESAAVVVSGLENNAPAISPRIVAGIPTRTIRPKASAEIRNPKSETRRKSETRDPTQGQAVLMRAGHLRDILT